MYYYFTGSYITDQMNHEKQTEIITQIFSDLSKEINFNIALFLAFSLNTEYDILPRILKITQGLLQKYEDFDYEDQRNLIKKLEADINLKLDKIFDIPENRNMPKIQERRAILEDALEELEEESKEEKEKIQNKYYKEFAQLLRINEFLGEVLKNYSSKIKREPRINILKLMTKSSLKSIGMLCDCTRMLIDGFILSIDEKIKDEDEEILKIKSSFKQQVKGLLSNFWLQFISVNVSHLSFCLQCDRLDKEMAEYQELINSKFFDMVRIEYLIRISNGPLPVKELQNLYSGKNKLDAFSKKVLKQNIYGYLSNVQYDERDKQTVCSIVGFKIKDMRIDEKMKEVLSNV